MHRDETKQFKGAIVRKLLLVVMLTCAAANLANAQEDDSIIGTHSVWFQPIQVGGELQGCTLVYRAVQNDSAYLDGSPVVIIGNIGIGQIGANVALTFKVGVKNLVENGTIVRPNFAYLQTKSYSTAKVKQQVMDGDEGFRLYAYSLFDSTVLNLYGEIMDSGTVTIAFNRKKGGMDVLVPIDLSVSDAAYPEGGKVVRKRSTEAVRNFASCSTTLMNQAMENNERSEVKKR
jgi:hypothetical protein